MTNNENVTDSFGSGIFNTVNVDLDFNGNIQAAIEGANSGDIVQLGDNTYDTDVVYIDKKIALQGTGNSIIDGTSDEEAVIILGSQADGTTISDLTITNGNNGIIGDRVENLTLKNLNVNNIGIEKPLREGNNNIGIGLSNAHGLEIRDSIVQNIGRKGVGVGDTVGAIVSGLTISDINLDAEHAQSHDAAGIKLFNTHAVTVSDNYVENVNATAIWNDTTNATSIINNTIEGVGENFSPPEFTDFVDVHGIYNEKSSNSFVGGNKGTAREGFDLYNSTEFTTETTFLGDNDFKDSVAIGTTDYWTNEAAETTIATTVDPQSANFELFADQYYDTAII